MVVGGRELIDTLWNVNMLNYINSHLVGFELIDTLWNVNAESPKDGAIVNGRINRYIMECKCKNRQSLESFAQELIDTLWNVNLTT